MADSLKFFADGLFCLPGRIPPVYWQNKSHFSKIANLKKMLTCNFITFAEAVRTMPENIPPPGIYFDLVCKIKKIIILLDDK